MNISTSYYEIIHGLFLLYYLLWVPSLGAYSENMHYVSSFLMTKNDCLYPVLLGTFRETLPLGLFISVAIYNGYKLRQGNWRLNVSHYTTFCLDNILILPVEFHLVCVKTCGIIKNTDELGSRNCSI